MANQINANLVSHKTLLQGNVLPRCVGAPQGPDYTATVGN